MGRMFQLVLLAGLAREARAQTHTVWDPATATWNGEGGGLKSSIVAGDPDKPGYYSVAYHLAPGSWIPPHLHPRAKQITVLSGSLRMGFGAILDSAKTRNVGAGRVMVMPPETVHFEGASVATVVLFSGEGPLVTRWVGKTAKP